MEKLKYHNLGLVDPDMVGKIWEYVPDCPTLFSYAVNKTTIIACGNDLLDKRIKVSEIPDGVATTRMITQGETSYILDENLIAFQFHYPNTKEYGSIIKSAKAITYKLLNGIGLTETGNDILFEKNGLKKKFWGGAEQPNIEGWKKVTFVITFDFNSELANKIYRFDDEKFINKGEITDISTIVGGLDEVIKLDRGKFTLDIVIMLAERYDLEVSEEPYE